MKKLSMNTIGHLLLAPLSILKSHRLGNIVYRKGLEMIVENNNAYALDTISGSNQALPEFYRPSEAFEKRFEQVRKSIRDVNAHNMLDIGCAEGYMISRAAKELGTFAIGLEMDRSRIRVGNARSELDDNKNYGIIPTSVNPELLKCVPEFDVVVCFSVLHHVIRHHGRDEAVEFLKAIRRKTRYRFLFDMGSPEETANDPEWGNVLAFLKGDVVGKNIELLELAGFVDVKHVGDTPGYIQTAIRPLFVCSPPN